jgi:pimeloyl-ACP methyl ester carboxylesterase
MTDTTFHHHTAFVNEVRLHYVTAGQGDPVVLLHGWPETWYQWRKIIPPLAEKYMVIAPDVRGLGDSSKPATGYDKRTIADDIYKLVRKLGGKYSFGKRTLTSLQTLAENVRGGEIDQCGHWVSEEQPEYLLEQLLSFFGEEG